MQLATIKNLGQIAHATLNVINKNQKDFSMEMKRRV
jgi:hypothetical protein